MGTIVYETGQTPPEPEVQRFRIQVWVPRRDWVDKESYELFDLAKRNADWYASYYNSKARVIDTEESG